MLVSVGNGSRELSKAWERRKLLADLGLKGVYSQYVGIFGSEQGKALIEDAEMKNLTEKQQKAGFSSSK